MTDRRQDRETVPARVAALHTKPRADGERGLPKLPVDSAVLDRAGLEGDYNVHRQTRRAGDPDKAVLVLTADVIEQLRREGWPVGAGDVGENVLLFGMRNADLTMGLRLALGDQVELELSREAEPCANLAVLPYVGPEKRTEFMQTLLGRRGWYARVISEGSVNVGDKVTLSRAPQQAENR